MHLNFSVEAGVWMLFALIGMIVSAMSLHEISLNAAALRLTGTDATPELWLIIKKDRIQELLRGSAQILAFLVGVVVVFFSNPAQPRPDRGLADWLTLVLLVGFEGLLVLKSAIDLYYTHRLINLRNTLEPAEPTPTVGPVTPPPASVP